METGTTAATYGSLYGNSAIYVDSGATAATAANNAGVPVLLDLWVSNDGDDLLYCRLHYPYRIVGGGEMINTTATGNTVVNVQPLNFMLPLVLFTFSLTELSSSSYPIAWLASFFINVYVPIGSLFRKNLQLFLYQKKFLL